MWIVLHSGLQYIDCFVLCFVKLIAQLFALAITYSWVFAMA